MWITKLDGDAWLLEANQLRVIAEPPLTTATSEEFAQFFRTHKRPHLLLVRDFSSAYDERLFQLARIFEWLPIFVIGGNTSVQRLRARGLRRIFHLGAYQFLNYKSLRFMGVPGPEDERVAAGWVFGAGHASAWFQGPQPPTTEVSRKTRIYLRRPLSAVIPPRVPETEAFSADWLCGTFTARADEVLLPAEESTATHRTQLLRADSQLHWQEYSPQQRLHLEGRESELARHLTPWSVRRPTRSRSVKSQGTRRPEVVSYRALTTEEQRRVIGRLVEVQLHLEFLKIIYEERKSPLQEWIDRRAVLQIEVDFAEGLPSVWHFSRWYPRCEIGYGSYPHAELVFKYRAEDVLAWVNGAASELRFLGGPSSLAQWHPFAELKGVWRKSLASPLLPDCERDRLLYRI